VVQLPGPRSLMCEVKSARKLPKSWIRGRSWRYSLRSVNRFTQPRCQPSTRASDTVQVTLAAQPVISNDRQRSRRISRGKIEVAHSAPGSGLLNVAEFYPWAFFFPPVHYAVAWIVIGALLVHISVKLPVIRTALSRPVDDPDPVDVDDAALPAVAPPASSLAESIRDTGTACRTTPL